jgi:phosphoglycerate kinase
MYKKKTIRDLDFTGRRVLVRVDFNVPLQDGEVLSDARILASLPTLTYLADAGAAVVICSHLGRPKGKKNPDLSLQPVFARMRQLIDRKVHFIADCIGKDALEAARSLPHGEFLLLENTRFYPGETENDPEFAAQLAASGEILVNDAFGTAHRAHASNVGVAGILPAVAGFLIEKELSFLGEALEAPDRPFVAVLGGSKISDKIEVVSRLLQRADFLLVGGGMANAFLEAKGFSMGASASEQEVVGMARELLDRAGKQIRLPVDLVVADTFAEDANHRTVTLDSVPEGWYSLDIGPKTIAEFSSQLGSARTVVWNGPMGVYEFKPFSRGTLAIAQAIAACNGMTIVGGGSSADAVALAGVSDQIDHVSTGGGASLRMLEGKDLPGVSVLLDSDALVPGWD